MSMLAEIDDDEFAKQLLEEFDKEFWEAIGQIRDGLKTGDMDTVKIAAHSIKGSAAVFGAMELSKAAEELEFAVKDGDKDVEKMSKMGDKIEKAFENADRNKLVETMM